MIDNVVLVFKLYIHIYIHIHILTHISMLFSIMVSLRILNIISFAMQWDLIVYPF